MSTTMVASEVKAVPPVISSIQDIPLEKIRESKTNPRTQFDQSKLAELAENIRQHGVLQPILVRSAASVFHWTVSVVDVVSIAVPPKRVVAVVVYDPAQAFLGIKNGNETDFEVPACIVNGGVANITVLVVAQDLGPSGPVKVNFTLTVCAAFLQDITVPVIVAMLPRETVDGLIPSAT